MFKKITFRNKYKFIISILLIISLSLGLILFSYRKINMYNTNQIGKTIVSKFYNQITPYGDYSIYTKKNLQDFSYKTFQIDNSLINPVYGLVYRYVYLDGSSISNIIIADFKITKFIELKMDSWYEIVVGGETENKYEIISNLLENKDPRIITDYNGLSFTKKVESNINDIEEAETVNLPDPFSMSKEELIAGCQEIFEEKTQKLQAYQNNQEYYNNQKLDLEDKETKILELQDQLFAIGDCNTNFNDLDG